MQINLKTDFNSPTRISSFT